MCRFRVVLLPKICELSACIYVAAEVMEMKKIANSGCRMRRKLGQIFKNQKEEKKHLEELEKQ